MASKEQLSSLAHQQPGSLPKSLDKWALVMFSLLPTVEGSMVAQSEERERPPSNANIPVVVETTSVPSSAMASRHDYSPQAPGTGSEWDRRQHSAAQVCRQAPLPPACCWPAFIYPGQQKTIKNLMCVLRLLRLLRTRSTICC